MRWPVVLSIAACLVAAGCGDDDDTGPTDTGPGDRDTGGRDTGPGDVDGGPGDVDGGPGDVDGGPGDVDGGPGDVDGGPGDVDAGPLPDDPPTTVTEVARDEGFFSPTDAVASLDGATFYFAAYTETNEAAIFSIASDGSGSARILHEGAPLEYPSGLVLNCDGSTLFIADTGLESGTGAGGVFSLAVAGGDPTPLAATGVDSANAIAFDSDCSNLYVSGRDPAGSGAVYSVPVAGGAATVVHIGAPLVSPTGLHVAADDTVWLLDHLATGDDGQGVLFEIPPGGEPEEVTSGLRLGTPGGVSLTAGGSFAIIGSRSATSAGQLSIVNLSTRTVEVVAASAIVDPAGLRTARAAGVFAIADSEGHAIFRAE